MSEDWSVQKSKWRLAESWSARPGQSLYLNGKDPHLIAPGEPSLIEDWEGEVEWKKRLGMDLGVFVRVVCGESRTYGNEGVRVYTSSVVVGPTHPICSMIYGSTGPTHFDQLAKILTGYEITSARSSGIFLGILSIAVGSLFNITAVPFQAAVERMAAYRW
ncbi:hypothetical protein VNO80_03206 [Phaseolus coccineus]|uniref:Uncharacterized protein n=1 Tax=Phaseolus coccineus TaxID=3886 RepID=A0AAN9NQV9_PHACN